MSEKFRQAVKDARAAFRLVRETPRDLVVLKQEGARFYASSPPPVSKVRTTSSRDKAKADSV